MTRRRFTAAIASLLAYVGATWRALAQDPTTWATDRPDPDAHVDDFSGDGPAVGQSCAIQQLAAGMRFEETTGRRGVEWVVLEPAGIVDDCANHNGPATLTWPGGFEGGWYSGGWIDPAASWPVVPMILAARPDTGDARLWSWGLTVRRTR